MSICCDHTAEDVLFLLKRNWVMDSQDVYSLFEELSEDVYSEVYYRRSELPLAAQMYFQDSTPVGKIRIGEYSEEDADRDEVERYETRTRVIREFKKTYIAPPRPREVIDDIFDQVQRQLIKKQESLDDMVRTMNRGRTFSQRKQEEEPMVRDTRAQVETLKNEFEYLKTRIESYDKLWSESNFLDAVPSVVAASRVKS